MVPDNHLVHNAQAATFSFQKVIVVYVAFGQTKKSSTATFVKFAGLERRTKSLIATNANVAIIRMFSPLMDVTKSPCVRFSVPFAPSRCTCPKNQLVFFHVNT